MKKPLARILSLCSIKIFSAKITQVPEILTYA